MVGSIPVVTPAPSCVVPPAPTHVGDGLSPVIVSTQLEHLLSMQQRLGTGPAFQTVEKELALLIDQVLQFHITECGEPYNVRHQQ